MLNNNFKQLVKKYETYRSNRIKRIVFAGLALMAILVAGYFAVFNSKEIVKEFKKPVVESNKTITVEPTPTKVVVEDKMPQRVEVDTPKSKLLPDLIYKRDTKNISNKDKFKLQVKERKNLYKLLTDHKEKDDYKSTVAIARFHFEEKNYPRAITWAVKASKKDPKESLPWIIYAKSKASLGKTDVAKKALSIYLKHSQSSDVQKLLNSLK
jgi:hypothetical protein